MPDPRLALVRICSENGIVLDRNQESLLHQYVVLLGEWNAKINLISRKDEQNIWFSHILHSIVPMFFIQIAPGARVLDLGSGGGLPGVPMAIVRHDLHITLVDSIRKKTTALQDMVKRLSLSNVDVICARAEELGREQQYGKKFDIVIARAVAPLVELIRWSRPLLSTGKERSATRGTAGYGGQGKQRFSFPFLVALKGGDLEKEISRARIQTGAQKIATVNLLFKGSDELGLEDKKMIIVEF